MFLLASSFKRIDPFVNLLMPVKLAQKLCSHQNKRWKMNQNQNQNQNWICFSWQLLYVIEWLQGGHSNIVDISSGMYGFVVMSLLHDFHGSFMLGNKDRVCSDFWQDAHGTEKPGKSQECKTLFSCQPVA